MVKTKSKIEDIVDVVKKLRNPKDGCPWDISQNSKSLAKYTLEEAYEVVEAIEQNKTDELKDELGDLLLQVVYHSVISEEKKQFNINDVIASSVKKMKLRHPHIFLNNKNIKTISDVNDFWEYQKKQVVKGFIPTLGYGCFFCFLVSRRFLQNKKKNIREKRKEKRKRKTQK